MSILLEPVDLRTARASAPAYACSLTVGRRPGVPSLASAADFARDVISPHKPSALIVTTGVARAAYALGWRLALSETERDLLTSAAWLHLIGVGIAPNPSPHGWLAVVAAMAVREAGYEPVASLIAWAGTSPEEARLTGVLHILQEFPAPDPRLVDALTYAITHSHPVTGAPCRLANRLVELRAQRGPAAMPVTAMESGWQRLHDIEASTLSSICVGPRCLALG